MYLSHFLAHFAANVRHMPRAVAADIRRAAIARLTERQQAGRADSPLLFDDLVARIETAVAGG